MAASARWKTLSRGPGVRGTPSRGMKNAWCGKRGLWETQGVENAGCGKRGVWKTRGAENARCGKREVWKTRGVDNTGSGGKHNNKNAVCKQMSSLSVALDEIPTATCEPSEIAT